MRELRRRINADRSFGLSRLACRPTRPPTGRGWIHEIKHDGFRVIAHRQGRAVRLMSRKASVRGFPATPARVEAGQQLED